MFLDKMLKSLEHCPKIHSSGFPDRESTDRLDLEATFAFFFFPALVDETEGLKNSASIEYCSIASPTLTIWSDNAGLHDLEFWFSDSVSIAMASSGTVTEP